MPHEWNNMIVVTKDELVPAWYSWPNLKLTIHRYQDKTYGIKKVRTGGGGHPMLIAFDSLPTEIKYALGDPRKLSHILEKYYKVDGEAVDFYKRFRFDDGTSLEMKHQEQYIVNASMLRALLLLKEAREAERRAKGTRGPREDKPRPVMETLRTDAIDFNELLEKKHQVRHTLPESLKRFKQALNDFQNFSYDSLISGKHRNSCARKVNESTLKLLNSMFANKRRKPTATEVHRQYEAFLNGNLDVIINETGELYNPQDFKKLSEKTVTEYLMRKWENKIATYTVRSGDSQKQKQQFKPHHSMDRPQYAGSLLSIDDRQPPFKCLELNGDRVWFYNALDVASDAFTCWVHGLDKKGIILEFYRQLVRNYAEWGFNLPAELEAEMNLNASFTNTFLREGAMFEYVRIEANNARGKVIESRFGPLRHRIEKKLEGWQARPHDKRESHQAGPDKVPLIPYKQIIEGSKKAIEEWNNEPHPTKPELSKWEYFEQMQNANLRPTNYEAFLPYIGKKTQTSCNVGHIRLNHSEFLLGINGEVATGEKLIGLMKQAEGQDLDVYWLDSNDGQVLKALVYLRGETKCICEAVAKPKYNRARIEQTPQCAINREIVSKYEATISGFGRRQKAELEPITIIDNTPARPKTFIMPGLRQPVLVDESYEPEMMPEAPEMEEIYVPSRSFVKPLLERY